MLQSSSSTRGHRQPRYVLQTCASLFILLPLLAQVSLAQNQSSASVLSRSKAVTLASPNCTVGETEEIDYGKVLRDVVTAGLSNVPPSVVRKLLAANVRPQCRAALLRTMKALQNFEPWVLRLMDATGKYPTGFFEGSCVDMGAFDQCLETTVRDQYGSVSSRGQYCNLLVHVRNTTEMQALMTSISSALSPRLIYFKKHGHSPGTPFARIALCYIDNCNQHDLQAMFDAIRIPLVRLEVSNCVTADPRPWNKTQIAIVVFGATLLVAVLLSTLVDHFAEEQCVWIKKQALLYQVALAFSAKSNTRMLLNVASNDRSDQQSLQFFHGVRCLTCMHIVCAHIYMIATETFTRPLNLFECTAKWHCMFLAAAFNSVDTFFFLSGFFLGHVIIKQQGNSEAVFIIAVIRRLVRICVPFFFFVMWLYLLPRFVSGPDTETFFQRFYLDVSEHWWQWLVQVRNHFDLKLTGILDHSWFMSADFQLFVISLLTLLTFRRRKSMALAALAMLSLLGCAISTWTMARLHVPPFVIMPLPRLSRMMSTVNNYYTKPFYHGVCYFSGCMTSLIVADYRVLNISKALRLAGWCVCISCGLFCVFVKLPWYIMEHPTSDTIEMALAFFDRILWSISVAWVTLECSTGRGGFVNKFFSWNAFVPLSKLSYGVYLIHWPFMTLMMLSSRERVDSSHFTRVTLFFGVLVWCFLLTYLLFITCEAPVAALDKLAFGMLIRGDSSRLRERQEKLEGSGKEEQRNGQRSSPTSTKNGAVGLGDLLIRRSNCKKSKVKQLNKMS